MFKKRQQIYYHYNKEKGRTSPYLRFRKCCLQKAFCLITKPQLDSNFVLTVD